MAPKAIENTERVSTFIPRPTLDELKELAKEKGMTVSGYIRMLILDDVSQKK